jgi:hypothetical protein
VSTVRSGALATWSRAWLTGQVGFDQVVDAVADADAPHTIEPAGDQELATLLDVLVAWRRAGESPRLLLPVAGDIRGLPGPNDFRGAALDAGEAVAAGGLGVVPEITSYEPSSAPASVIWFAYATDVLPPDHLDVGEAQYELTTAIRESASALAAADVAGGLADVAGTLRDARRAGEFLNLPPDYPSRAVALLAQAERLQAVLDLALDDPVGGAVDQNGMARRADALRPLATAVRRGRLAGYNATCD